MSNNLYRNPWLVNGRDDRCFIFKSSGFSAAVDYRPYRESGGGGRSRTVARAKFCTNCREELRGGDQFCPYCGETIQPVEQSTNGRSAEITACDCLTILREVDEYCPTCGKPNRQRR